MAPWLFPLTLSDASEIGLPCLVVVFPRLLHPVSAASPLTLSCVCSLSPHPVLCPWPLLLHPGSFPNHTPLCLLVLCALWPFCLLYSKCEASPLPWVMLGPLPLSLRNSEEEWYLKISGQSPYSPHMLHILSLPCLAARNFQQRELMAQVGMAWGPFDAH